MIGLCKQWVHTFVVNCISGVGYQNSLVIQLNCKIIGLVSVAQYMYVGGSDEFFLVLFHTLKWLLKYYITIT